MKKIFLIFVIIILIPMQAWAVKATTVENIPACFSKESLDEMMQFIYNKDEESFNAYLKMGKCIILKGDIDVTVIDMPGMFGGTVSFIYKGIKLWTKRNGLKNYR